MKLKLFATFSCYPYFVVKINIYTLNFHICNYVDEYL